MSDEKKRNQNLFLIVISFILSFLLGILGFFLINRNKAIHPDKILNNMKDQFRKKGSIEGSWIEMTKVPWSEGSYKKEVYYGGLSRFEGEKIKHYEFIADAYTGNLIDLYEI